MGPACPALQVAAGGRTCFPDSALSWTLMSPALQPCGGLRRSPEGPGSGVTNPGARPLCEGPGAHCGCPSPVCPLVMRSPEFSAAGTARPMAPRPSPRPRASPAAPLLPRLAPPSPSRRPPVVHQRRALGPGRHGPTVVRPLRARVSGPLWCTRQPAVPLGPRLGLRRFCGEEVVCSPPRLRGLFGAPLGQGLGRGWVRWSWVCAVGGPSMAH